MAARVRRIEEELHPDVAKFEWLTQAKDAFLACRGQGHAWPKLRPGRLPKGIRHVRQPEGQVELIFTCRDCGMVRRLVTSPTGEIDFPAKYTYEQPEGYKAPKGVSVTRREALAESWRRTLEDITKPVEVLRPQFRPPE